MRALIVFVMLFSSLLAEDIQLQLNIKGMTCPTCTRAVKIALSSVNGVKSAKVYLNDERAVVIADKSVPLETLLEAVKKTGYKAELKKE